MDRDSETRSSATSWNLGSQMALVANKFSCFVPASNSSLRWGTDDVCVYIHMLYVSIIGTALEQLEDDYSGVTGYKGLVRDIVGPPMYPVLLHGTPVQILLQGPWKL